jgi:hypothetical protein
MQGGYRAAWGARSTLIDAVSSYNLQAHLSHSALLHSQRFDNRSVTLGDETAFKL